MTSLKKPVRRVTARTYRILYSQPRAVVVTLAPGDVIQFREQGRRAVFALPIDRAFSYAVRLHAEAQASIKRAERKAKRAARAAQKKGF